MSKRVCITLILKHAFKIIKENFKIHVSKSKVIHACGKCGIIVPKCKLKIY